MVDVPFHQTKPNQTYKEMKYLLLSLQLEYALKVKKLIA